MIFQTVKVRSLLVSDIPKFLSYSVLKLVEVTCSSSCFSIIREEFETKRPQGASRHADGESGMLTETWILFP